jgi:hypothetical protein
MHAETYSWTQPVTSPPPATPDQHRRSRHIEECSDAEIIRIIEWIESGPLRTVQQLIDDKVGELGSDSRQTRGGLTAETGPAGRGRSCCGERRA